MFFFFFLPLFKTRCVSYLKVFTSVCVSLFSSGGGGARPADNSNGDECVVISDSDDEPGLEAGEAEQGHSQEQEEDDEEEEEEGDEDEDEEDAEAEEEDERGQSAGQC